MQKSHRQEFIIKSCPTDDTEGLEYTLNTMCKEGWELYTLLEGEGTKGTQFNCIFVREVYNDDLSDTDDVSGFKSKMERMFDTKEEPYELAKNLQKKICEKRDKIQEIKRFLETAREDERAVLNSEISNELETLNSLKKQLNKLLSPHNMTSTLGEERLSINLGSNAYEIYSVDVERNLLSETVRIRQELAEELGYILPKVAFIENPSIEENRFSINIHGIPVAEGYVYPNHKMYFAEDLNIKNYPKGSIKEQDFITSKKIVWIPIEETKDYWQEGIEPAEYVAIYLKYFAVRNVFEIFNYADINRYIELVSENNAFLVDSILGDFITVPELKYIFCQLIRERVSIKDIIYIFEKINDFAEDESKVDLLDKIRVALSRQISHSLADEDRVILGYEINEATIAQIEKQTEYSEDEESSIVRINGSKFNKLIKSITKISNEDRVVLVAPQHLRQILFALISELYIDIPIICPEEVSLEYDLKIIGTV